MNYAMIKKYFDKGFWDAHMVAQAVVKGVITPAQYQEITGQVYEPAEPAAGASD